MQVYDLSALDGALLGGWLLFHLRSVKPGEAIVGLLAAATSYRCSLAGAILDLCRRLDHLPVIIRRLSALLPVRLAATPFRRPIIGDQG